MINIQFQNDHVNAGQFIQGEVMLKIPADWKVNKVLISAIWSIDGNSKEKSEIDVKVLRLGKNIVHTSPIDFSFMIPSEGPITFDGELFRITWGVHVEVAISLATDRKKHFPFIVLPKQTALE